MFLRVNSRGRSAEIMRQNFGQSLKSFYPFFRFYLTFTYAALIRVPSLIPVKSREQTRDPTGVIHLHLLPLSLSMLHPLRSCILYFSLYFPLPSLDVTRALRSLIADYRPLISLFFIYYLRILYTFSIIVKVLR